MKDQHGRQHLVNATPNNTNTQRTIGKEPNRAKGKVQGRQRAEHMHYN
jgi:hypothetical protein